MASSSAAAHDRPKTQFALGGKRLGHARRPLCDRGLRVQPGRMPYTVIREQGAVTLCR